MFGFHSKFKIGGVWCEGMHQFTHHASRFTAFPIILGRPWLRAVGAIQDWKKGVISLCDRKGDVKWFDMESREPISDVDEDEEEDDDTSDSTGSEESATSSSESEWEANVSYLLVDEEEQEKVPNVFDVSSSFISTA